MLKLPNLEKFKADRFDSKTQQTADKAADKISAYGEKPSPTSNKKR
jgi:hypothetical protein